MTASETTPRGGPLRDEQIDEYVRVALDELDGGPTQRGMDADGPWRRHPAPPARPGRVGVLIAVAFAAGIGLSEGVHVIRAPLVADPGPFRCGIPERTRVTTSAEARPPLDTFEALPRPPAR